MLKLCNLKVFWRTVAMFCHLVIHESKFYNFIMALKSLML